MSAPVDVLAVLSPYLPLIVEEWSGDHVDIMDDETAGVTIATLRGPQAKERAEAIVSVVNGMRSLMFALRRLEWSNREWPDNCPVCVQHRSIGHKDGCELYAALRAVGGAP